MPAEHSTVHISEEELVRYVSARTGSERASYIRSHILACSNCEARLAGRVFDRLAELRVSPSYRAREPREPTGSCAFLQPLCPLSLETIEVQIVDTSKSGFGLLMPGFLQPGTLVHLKSGVVDAVGTVRYCETAGEGQHKAGVQAVRTLKGLDNGHALTPGPKRGEH